MPKKFPEKPGGQRDPDQPLEERPGHGRPDRRLSSEDQAALDAFCDAVEFEDLDFETWQAQAETLDVTVPLFLDSEEARSGGRFLVRYSRQVGRQPDGTAAREKISQLIDIPTLPSDGDVIVVSGEGDRDQGGRGDLRVIVHLKG